MSSRVPRNSGVRQTSWNTGRHLVNFIGMRPLSGRVGGPLRSASLTHTLATNPDHCWAPMDATRFPFETTLLLAEGAKAPDASVKLEIVFSGSFWSMKPCSPEACLAEASSTWGHSPLRWPLFCVWTPTRNSPSPTWASASLHDRHHFEAEISTGLLMESPLYW